MTLRFGTDGIRGVAGRDLTPELVLAVGRAAARVIGEGRPFLVGRDTRWSGPVLQAAFSAGVAAEGCDVVDLGVLPTPAVASAAASGRVPAAVISASHNPYPDNGIKLLASGGRKLTDVQEQLVEEAIARIRAMERAAIRPADGPADLLEGDRLGRLGTDPDAVLRYCDQVVDALGGRSLGGVRVVLDCGHGAAVTTAARVLTAAGAEVVEVLGAAPDGRNINDGCGSTDPSGLSRAVRSHRAAAGLAFDGDADRLIAVDEQGRVVDGDRLLALFATDLQARGGLDGGGVVVTVMTNLGFHQAMDAAGIPVAATPVGDRYILEEMDRSGWRLGGEQSGHIIFGRLATTGDGVLTGAMLLDLLARTGRSLSDLAEGAMVRLPQVLLNVAVADLAGLASASPVWDEVRAVEAELGGDGRVLLRPSGTEPLVRVMVEAPTEAVAARAAERLARAVAAALGPA